MSAEMRANTIPNLLKKMIAHVATSAVFVHSVHFVHVKCIKVYEATVLRRDDTAKCNPLNGTIPAPGLPAAIVSSTVAIPPTTTTRSR